QLVQKEVTGADAVVVATEAVELNGGPLRFGMLRALVRALREGLGVGRNDTDGTRNADKPSNESHISHHLASSGPRIFVVDCDTGKQGSNRDTFSDHTLRQAQDSRSHDGVAVCATCGGGMTLRTGTSCGGKVYRYYTCSTEASKASPPARDAPSAWQARRSGD